MQTVAQNKSATLPARRALATIACFVISVQILLHLWFLHPDNLSSDAGAADRQIYLRFQLWISNTTEQQIQKWQTVANSSADNFQTSISFLPDNFFRQIHCVFRLCIFAKAQKSKPAVSASIRDSSLKANHFAAFLSADTFSGLQRGSPFVFIFYFGF